MADLPARAKTSVNLSHVLMGVAATIGAGLVGAVVALTSKASTVGLWILGVSALISLGCLVYSLYAGGKAIANTAASTAGKKDNEIPNKYDCGYFNRQAISGLCGLLIGVVGIVVVIVFGQKPPALDRPQVDWGAIGGGRRQVLGVLKCATEVQAEGITIERTTSGNALKLKINKLEARFLDTSRCGENGAAQKPVKQSP